MVNCCQCSVPCYSWPHTSIVGQGVNIEIRNRKSKLKKHRWIEKIQVAVECFQRSPWNLMSSISEYQSICIRNLGLINGILQVIAIDFDLFLKDGNFMYFRHRCQWCRTTASPWCCLQYIMRKYVSLSKYSLYF